jgi:hypothetical protein
VPRLPYPQASSGRLVLALAATVREEREGFLVTAQSGNVCEAEVVRAGQSDPCGEAATGTAWWEGEPFPACATHACPDCTEREPCARHRTDDDWTF